jgi:2-polyprenyl-3-methyl-5-hydroxy-6-metoxy-1,4-benzoquinol methylase
METRELLRPTQPAPAAPAVEPNSTECEADGHADRGVNRALLAALPAAKRVLEFGCATGALGRRYKGLHPAASWTGVEVNDPSLAAARRHLDSAHRIDLDVDSIASVGAGFDLIVLGDVLEHLKRPEALLRDLLAV